jgi:hypothetical protein
MKDMVLCARKRKTGNSSYIIATSLENLNSEIFVGKLKSNNLIGTRYDSGIGNLSSKKGSETGFLAQNLDRLVDKDLRVDSDRKAEQVFKTETGF